MLFSAFQLHYLPIDTATLKAWSQPYVGEAHKCLYKVMEKQWEKAGRNAYGRFLSIVQSSGTGKSRMIDELSKEHLVVPINLRPENETGELTLCQTLNPLSLRILQDFLGQITMSANSSTNKLSHMRCIPYMQPFLPLYFDNSKPS